MSEHVQNVPENPPIPPGAQMDPADEQQPAVVIPAESGDESETAIDTTKKQRATGPRKLNNNEKKVVQYWLDEYIGESDSIDKRIAFADLHDDVKAFFQPSMRDNVVARGIFNAEYNDQTQQLETVYLTELGFSLWKRADKVTTATKTKKVAAEKTAKVTKSRGNAYPDNLLVRKMTDTNPRRAGSHGYFAWNLYEDGMTYSQYIKKEKDPTLVNSSGTAFTGPQRNHFDEDLRKGYIALYDRNEPEELENGAPNPNYWAIRNRLSRAE